MGATEDQLKHEAETQRARMGDTLEAIGDRLSPERMVERRKAAVGQTFRNMKESVMGSPGYQEPATDRLRAQAESARDSATSAVHTTPIAASRWLGVSCSQVSECQNGSRTRAPVTASSTGSRTGQRK